jgi:hypothetical protein
VFGLLLKTSPVTLPASDCLAIILEAIDFADKPGRNEAPNIINGGGNGIAGFSGILKTLRRRFIIPLKFRNEKLVLALGAFGVFGLQDVFAIMIIL